MGLFQQRPEEPTEWGGLPAEPWQRRDGVDRLDDPPVADATSLVGGGAHSTIEISLDAFAPDASDGNADEPEENGSQSA